MMASPTRAIRRRCCWATSIAFTVSAVRPIRLILTEANMASSSTEPRRKEMAMFPFRMFIGASRAPAGLAIRAAMVAGCALFVAACNTDQQVAGAPEVPFDYRLLHPISITETQHNVEIFVGSNRGELNASERAALAEFAANWKHEATGGVVVNVPVGSSNQRAAGEVM